MIVYRLANPTYARDITGTGAKTYGGRWNGVGTPMLYTAPQIGTTLAEHLVHIEDPELYPNNQLLVEIYVPDSATVLQIDPSMLKPGWSAVPAPVYLQEIGNKFILSREALILSVPSVGAPGTYNYLLNPLHPEFIDVYLNDLYPYPLDERIVSLFNKGLSPE